MINFKNQSGRSMIEMLGVLAIIGVLSVGGIAGYSKAMNKYRINKTIEQITLIAGNVRTFFAPQKNYVGVLCGFTCGTACYGSDGGVGSNGSPTYAENGCPIIKKAKILPDEMLTVNVDGKITAISNPFGISVRLGSSNKAQSSGSDNQAFSITYNINNEEACIELVTHDWTAANARIIMFGGVAGPGDSSKTCFTLPMDIDTAVERCSTLFARSKRYGGNSISLSFYFDIDGNSTYWQNQLN